MTQIFQELRDFRQENLENLKEIKEDIKKTNNRIDEVEKRIAESGGGHFRAHGAPEASQDENDGFGGALEKGECSDSRGKGRSGRERPNRWPSSLRISSGRSWNYLRVFQLKID